MMWNSNTMLVNSKKQYYQKLSRTLMKEMSLNPDHLNDTCRNVQNHILASTTTTALTLWISAQKRSILLLSLSIMLRDNIKKVFRIGSLKDGAKKRSDDKEYEFSYADLPRLSVNNVEDMYLLQNRDQEQGRRYSAWSGKLSKNSQPHQTNNLSKVKKFSDGTLVKIQENLIDMLSKNKLGSSNKRLKGRD
ncbi:hypothetical protein Tco_0814637 [Tanacetum coccineum]